MTNPDSSTWPTGKIPIVSSKRKCLLVADDLLDRMCRVCMCIENVNARDMMRKLIIELEESKDRRSSPWN